MKNVLPFLASPWAVYYHLWSQRERATRKQSQKREGKRIKSHHPQEIRSLQNSFPAAGCEQCGGWSSLHRLSLVLPVREGCILPFPSVQCQHTNCWKGSIGNSKAGSPTESRRILSFGFLSSSNVPSKRRETGSLGAIKHHGQEPGFQTWELRHFLVI